MAVPKRKTSKQKRGQRRAQCYYNAGKLATIVEDPHTGEYRRSHCMSASGMYKGRQVLKIKKKKEADEE